MTRPVDEHIRCSAPQCPASRVRLATDPSDSYARAAGWHVHWEPTSEFIMGDQVFRVLALCPDHAGNAKRQTGPVHLDGEQTLW